MKIHENYIAAVNFLRENPGIVVKAWSMPFEHPGGILFGFCSTNRIPMYDTNMGCLTLVKGGWYEACSPSLTERIRADVRIPCYAVSEALIANLMVFAEWQQIMDDELEREPPPLHNELIPYLPTEDSCCEIHN